MTSTELDLICPLLKNKCIGPKCMWWVDVGIVLPERKCAIARLAMFKE